MSIAHLLNDFLIADSVEVMQLLHSIGRLDAYKYNFLPSTEHITNTSKNPRSRLSTAGSYRAEKNAPKSHMTLTFDLWHWYSIGF